MVRIVYVGGGGGDRTRVRRCFLRDAYVRISPFQVSRRRAPVSGIPLTPAPFFSPRTLGRTPGASLLYRRSLPTTQARSERTRLLKQPLPAVRWQLNFPVCFTSQRDLGTQSLPLPSPSNPIRPHLAIGRSALYCYSKTYDAGCQRKSLGALVAWLPPEVGLCILLIDKRAP